MGFRGGHAEAQPRSVICLAAEYQHSHGWPANLTSDSNFSHLNDPTHP
jgi:hypothetical protein